MLMHLRDIELEEAEAIMDMVQQSAMEGQVRILHGVLGSNPAAVPKCIKHPCCRWY